MKKVFSLVISMLITVVVLACSSEPTQFKLTVNKVGEGEVTIIPQNEIYEKDAEVEITATPNTGWKFLRWEGDLSGSEKSVSIKMDADKTITARFIKLTFYEDFEQNDGKWSTKYTYELSPEDSTDKKPFVQQTTVYAGEWSAQFGDIDDSEVSSFTMNVTLEKDSYLSFSYKVSSELNYDKLFFYVDDYIKLVESGDVDWKTYEGEIPSGEHTLKWTYEKDIVSDKGQDTAWVDNIVISDALPKHTLNINTTGYGNIIKRVDGDISQNVMYEEGTHITLEAVPGYGESFTKWGGADAPAGHLTDSIVEVVMGTSDMNIDAIFTGTYPDIEWLLMMYIGGDCNLEEFLWEDLNEMELGLYKLDEDVRSKVKIVALWDGIPGESDYPPVGAKLYELGPDSKLNTMISTNTQDLTASKWWEGNEIDMSDGANLTAFLNWVKENYTGYGYTMLMLSDHGGGARNRNTKPQKGAIWDDTTGGDEYFLETKEITQAITSAGFTGDHKLSILGFDACLMASVEEAYEHRTVADYYVASLQTEQGDGWEYNHWIPQITKGMSPIELGTLIVKSYHDNFTYISDQTLSCTDLSRMDALKTAIDELGKDIKDKDLVQDCKANFEKSISFDGGWAYLYEVGDFVSRLSSTTVSIKANAIVDAMKSAIVYSWAGSVKGNYYGPGSVTGMGLHLMGEKCDTLEVPEFEYDESVFSFANGSWADLYNEWYP